jgi:hypothetical protein
MSQPWEEFDLGSAGVPVSAQRAVRAALREMYLTGQSPDAERAYAFLQWELGVIRDRITSSREAIQSHQVVIQKMTEREAQIVRSMHGLEGAL